jgi:hypothetical protein
MVDPDAAGRSAGVRGPLPLIPGRVNHAGECSKRRCDAAEPAAVNQAAELGGWARTRRRQGAPGADSGGSEANAFGFPFDAHQIGVATRRHDAAETAFDARATAGSGASQAGPAGWVGAVRSALSRGTDAAVGDAVEAGFARHFAGEDAARRVLHAGSDAATDAVGLEEAHRAARAPGFPRRAGFAWTRRRHTPGGVEGIGGSAQQPLIAVRGGEHPARAPRGSRSSAYHPGRAFCEAKPAGAARHRRCEVAGSPPWHGTGAARPQGRVDATKTGRARRRRPATQVPLRETRTGEHAGTIGIVRALTGPAQRAVPLLRKPAPATDRGDVTPATPHITAQGAGQPRVAVGSVGETRRAAPSQPHASVDAIHVAAPAPRRAGRSGAIAGLPRGATTQAGTIAEARSARAPEFRVARRARRATAPSEGSVGDAAIGRAVGATVGLGAAKRRDHAAGHTGQ